MNGLLVSVVVMCNVNIPVMGPAMEAPTTRACGLDISELIYMILRIG